MRRLSAPLIVIFLLGGLLCARTPPAVAASSSNALTAKVRTELATFTKWLAANRAKGAIGEVGWPGQADAAEWNAIARAWYADAARAQLWVTAWATGEWWGTNYGLTPYQARFGFTVDSPSTQAAVIEAQPASRPYLRGVNVNGGEFGVREDFSNANPGRYDQDYHYDGRATFNYLAMRGIKLVRLPFRWERLQPTRFGRLDSAELARLRAVVARARAARLIVILDMHNYGRYRTACCELTLGSSRLRLAFADAWKRISSEFKNTPGVAYGLMNEPHDLTGGAVSWERASQSAVRAIRSTGDRKLILVGGYDWSAAQHWSQQHPHAWITDPIRNIRYEAHHYFDRDRSGRYARGFAEENSAASAHQTS